MNARDLRDPEVLTDRTGRKLVIDQAVLDPMRGVVPADEPFDLTAAAREFANKILREMGAAVAASNDLLRKP